MIVHTTSQKTEQPRGSAAAQPADAEPRLKVCVLAACPFPANHGTPGSIREIAEATAARGHEVHVVTYHFGEEIPLRGVHLHRVKALTRESTVVVGPTARRPLYDLQMVIEGIKVIRRHKIDLIHAHGYEAALAATLCRLVTRRPFIYSAHNSMSDELASYDFFRFKWMARSLAWGLDTIVPRLGNRCIPHSENLSNFLAARGLADRSEPVINFGIDLDEPVPTNGRDLRAEYNLGDGPIVLYTGVMDHFQRLDLLLEAMVPVVRRRPTARLVLVVTVPNEKHEAAIRAQAAQLGLQDHILLTDPQELDGVRRFLQICDVAVVPRPGAPGFPIKLLNYMAAERASVMFESSASGLKHGEHLLLVKPDTGEALGESILRLIDDPALRQRLSQNAFDFVREHHDRRVTARRVCDAYVHALQPTRRWKQISQRPRVTEPTQSNTPSPQGAPAAATADLDFARAVEVSSGVKQ